MPISPERDTLRAERMHRPASTTQGELAVTWSSLSYLFLAFLAMLACIAILVAFVVLPDNGTPFDRGDTPSQVHGGCAGRGEPVDVGSSLPAARRTLR